MIIIEAYKPEHRTPLNYILDEEQMQYTALAATALEKIGERNRNNDFHAKPITILDSGIPVGFFVLDFGTDKLELSQNQNSVLIRSLSVNPSQQGIGVAKNAMSKIPEFLKLYYPETNEMVLAVDEINTKAFSLYQKLGFVYEGKTRNGRSGLQKILFQFI